MAGSGPLRSAALGSTPNAKPGVTEPSGRIPLVANTSASVRQREPELWPRWNATLGAGPRVLPRRRARAPRRHRRTKTKFTRAPARPRRPPAGPPSPPVPAMPPSQPPATCTAAAASQRPSMCSRQQPPNAPSACCTKTATSTPSPGCSAFPVSASPADPSALVHRPPEGRRATRGDNRPEDPPQEHRRGIAPRGSQRGVRPSATAHLAAARCRQWISGPDPDEIWDTPAPQTPRATWDGSTISHSSSRAANRSRPRWPSARQGPSTNTATSTPSPACSPSSPGPAVGGPRAEPRELTDRPAGQRPRRPVGRLGRCSNPGSPSHAWPPRPQRARRATRRSSRKGHRARLGRFVWAGRRLAPCARRACGATNARFRVAFRPFGRG
jgi:hypothetical protein